MHQALGMSCSVYLSVCLGAYGYFKEIFLWEGYPYYPFDFKRKLVGRGVQENCVAASFGVGYTVDVET